MATYDEAMSALRKADAAGNAEDAQKLAKIASGLKPSTPSMLDKAKDTLPGQVAETALAVGSGIAGQVVGGLAGASTAVSDAVTGKEDPMKHGSEVSEKIQQKMQYSPTGKAKEGLEKVGKVADTIINKPARELGEWSQEHGGSPLVATVTDVTAQALTTAALDMLGIGTIKGVSRATDATTAAVAKTADKSLSLAAELTGSTKKQLQEAAPKHFEAALTDAADKKLASKEITPEQHEQAKAMAKEIGAMDFADAKKSLQMVEEGDMLGLLHKSALTAAKESALEGWAAVKAKVMKDPVAYAALGYLSPKILAAAVGKDVAVDVLKNAKKNKSLSSLATKPEDRDAISVLRANMYSK